MNRSDARCLPGPGEQDQEDSGSLKINDGTYPDHRFVMHALGRTRRVPNSSGRPDRVLKVGLQLPPWRDLILIGRFKDRFSTALRITRRVKRCGIPIKAL